MKKKSLFLLYIFFLYTVFLLVQDTFLWKISGNGCNRSSYIFGILHLLNDGYLEQYPKVLKLFERAQAILVESDIGSATMVPFSMKAVMMDDEVLPDLVTPQD